MGKIPQIISIISLLFLISCQSLDYGAGAVGNYTSGFFPWLVRKPLEKAFSDGSDDFFEDLSKSQAQQKEEINLEWR